MTGVEPSKWAIHRVAVIRSRSWQATRGVWLYALCTASRRVSAGTRRFRASEWAATPQQHNGDIFAVTVRMDSSARPTAGPRGAVAATSVLDCDAVGRAPRIQGDHSHAAAHAALEGVGPFRVARRARPHQGANRTAPSRRVPAPVAVTAACPSFIPASASGAVAAPRSADRVGAAARPVNPRSTR